MAAQGPEPSGTFFLSWSILYEDPLVTSATVLSSTPAQASLGTTGMGSVSEAPGVLD